MEVKKLLIIPDVNNLKKYEELADEYNIGFEYNDFFLPDDLDNEDKINRIIQSYKDSNNLPGYCTSHGAFLDVTVFSDDKKILEVSDYRVEQSLKIAIKLGAKGVVFHTNYIPSFTLASYRESWVEKNYLYWSKKLELYPDINIYMENMFDADCELLVELAKRLSKYKNFGICFDYAHAHVFGDEKKIDNWVKAVGPYVKHMHINDNDFMNDLHLPLGQGKIDWKRFKQHYEQHFSEASVLIELKGYEQIKDSVNFIKAL